MAGPGSCIAGIDFGTSKVALVLADAETESILFSESEPHGGYLGLSDPLLREQSVDAAMETLGRLFRRLEDSLRALRTPHSPRGCEIDIRSIGLTGQMHGIVGVGGGGNAVTNLVTWQDGRGHAAGKDGKSLLELMGERGGTRKIASGYGIVTLFDWTASRRHPGLATFCTMADYAAMRLAGSSAPALDPTMADSVGAFDAGKGAWDSGYISALGIDASLFPPVTAPGTVMGKARLSGVGRGAKVSVALGDNQASFIGSVRDHYATLLVNVGTGSQVSFAARSAREAADLADVDGYDVVLRPFVRGGVLAAGNAISGGAVYGALKDFFARVGRELFGADAAAETLYERMEKSALEALALEAAAGGERLDVYPLFFGKRSAPAARGRIDGIGPANFTPASLVLGTLEGEMRILKEMVPEKAFQTLETLVGSGNGLRRNPLLRAAAEKVFGKALLVPVHEEEAALGAAIHGAVAAGVFRDYRDARGMIGYATNERGHGNGA